MESSFSVSLSSENTESTATALSIKGTKMKSDILALDSFPTHKTFLVSFFDDAIQTTVTHKTAAISLWIRDDIELLIHRRNLNAFVVGLDIKPHPSTTGRNPVATLQLCVGRSCLIYQLQCADDFPDCLNDFLVSESNTFVGVDILTNLEKLAMDYRFQVPASNAVDLGVLAARVCRRDDLKNADLEELARVVLGREMGKAPESDEIISPWDSPRLTDDQVKYASVDAFVCFEVGRVLLNSPNHQF